MTYGTTLDVTPAFGRDYTTLEQAIAHWDAGKDFRQVRFCGVYLSKRDANVLIGQGIDEIRFVSMSGLILGTRKL